MHHCLSVDEILRLLACELVTSKAMATAVALACCCKSFEDPALDAIWETQRRLIPLLKCFPQDVWEGDGSFVSSLIVVNFPTLNRLVMEAFKRVPTKEEWTHSQKYARRMRQLEVDTTEDPASLDIITVLQLRIINGPWLPNLETFECEKTTKAFLPFIPILLSPKTTRIVIGFAKSVPKVAAASTIARLSKLCPDLESITLNILPRDPVITGVVSEMLLACNRDTLRGFYVNSPLTKEAREVVYRLPKLVGLWGIIQGPTSLPTMALPNLTAIYVEYDDDLSWLQGFRGAALERLEAVTFHSESKKIGDFLGAFESAALTTSTHWNALSKFRFRTLRSWNPNYSSLLSLNRMRELEIEFSCGGSCSSRVDDDIVMSLARTMPELEILQLGRMPCNTPTGVTVNGLIGLARRCLHLSKLCIHFQATSLVEAATSAATISPSGGDPVFRQEDCALADLQVGEIPIPTGSVLTVAHVLLQIFPRILNIEYTNQEWKTVAETITYFRQIATFVHRAGEAYLSHLVINGDTLPGDAID